MERLGNDGKCLVDIPAFELKGVQRPFDPHEKRVALLVNMLVGMDDIPLILKDKVRDSGSDAFLVAAGYQ
jgi:hypothetical protein